MGQNFENRFFGPKFSKSIFWAKIFKIDFSGKIFKIDFSGPTASHRVKMKQRRHAFEMKGDIEITEEHTDGGQSDPPSNIESVRSLDTVSLRENDNEEPGYENFL